MSALSNATGMRFVDGRVSALASVMMIVQDVAGSPVPGVFHRFHNPAKLSTPRRKAEADLEPVRCLATRWGAGNQDAPRWFILVVALLLVRLRRFCRWRPPWINGELSCGTSRM
jgi:hypothetical protein